MASGEKILQYFKSNVCFKGLECNLFFIDEKLDFNEFNVPFVCIINTKSKYGYAEGKESHWVCLYYNAGDFMQRKLLFVHVSFCRILKLSA